MKIKSDIALTETSDLDLLSKKTLLQSANILELGCGTAFVTRKLSERYPDAKIIAAEVDEIQHNCNWMPFFFPMNNPHAQGEYEGSINPNRIISRTSSSTFSVVSSVIRRGLTFRGTAPGSRSDGDRAGQGATGEVVNDLSVDLLVAAEHGETWTLSRALNTTTNAGLDAHTRFGFLFRIHGFGLFRGCFARLATDLFTHKAHTFSFVRLDFAQRADFGGHHAKQLLVM